MNRDMILLQNFKSRSIDVIFCESISDARNKIDKMIPKDCSIGIGHSKTLENMDITKYLLERGNTVYDKSLSNSKEEKDAIKKKAILADWYITGSNAISKEGHIVNIDHSGNRVASMLYGPDNVIIVVGMNKVVTTLEEAIYRAKNIAAPQNALRAGYNPPCVKLNKCIDCKSEDRVCNYLVIIEGQAKSGRMKLFIVDEEIGY